MAESPHPLKFSHPIRYFEKLYKLWTNLIITVVICSQKSD